MKDYNVKLGFSQQQQDTQLQRTNKFQQKYIFFSFYSFLLVRYLFSIGFFGWLAIYYSFAIVQ